MPEETNTPPADDAPQTAAPQTPPAGPGTMPDPPAAPSVPRLEPDADLERVRRLYHNLSGQFQVYAEQAELYRGRLEQRLRTAEQAVRTSHGRVESLTGERTTLQERLAGVPELQEQAGRVETLEGQVARMQLLMQYPQIVNAVQVQTVEGEDGQTSETRSNPTLELLMSSSLAGDEFASHVDAFVQALPTGNSPAPTDAGATTPPTPAPRSAADDLHDRAMAAMLEGDYEESQRLLDQFQEEQYSQP